MGHFEGIDVACKKHIRLNQWSGLSERKGMSIHKDSNMVFSPKLMKSVLTNIVITFRPLVWCSITPDVLKELQP